MREMARIHSGSFPTSAAVVSPAFVSYVPPLVASSVAEALLQAWHADSAGANETALAAVIVSVTDAVQVS